MLRSLILIFLFYTSLVAQSFEFSQSIGKFERASSFYITANGLIYVSDAGKDEIVMFDTSGNNLKSFGGYGWDENSFDEPSDVFADPLSIYVADKNNNAIKRFDKNLNYLSSLNTRETDYAKAQFRYPLSCATSNQGDLYFIDSENKRIMKFDIFGKFIINFGGLDAGKYQLSNPTQLAIASSNNIFVIDGKDIVVFDQYGNGVSRIYVDKILKSIRILFDQLVVCTENEVYHSFLKDPESNLNRLSLSGIEVPTINSAILFNKKLYVLTNKSVLIFNKII